jgi:hypothetical protein
MPHAKRARRGGKSPEFKDARKDFHLARAIYIQSGHCDFISQMIFQTKVYCVLIGASNYPKPTLQFQQRRPKRLALTMADKAEAKYYQGDNYG